MQPVEGMARVQWGERESRARAAAQATQQQTIQITSIERLVVQEIEAWQRDKDPGHLLKAIDALQGAVSMSAGLANSTAGVAAEVAGASHSWQPTPQAGGFRPSEGSIPAGGLTGAAQDLVDRAAEYAKGRVRNTFRNVESAAERAAKLLEGVAEAARQGGAQAAHGGAHGGFGGRASGSIPGAQQGGFGGRTGGSTQQHGGAGSSGGFGGRASGDIPRR